MTWVLAAALSGSAAVGWGQSDRAFARKGNELYKRGNYPEAADSYRQAIIRKPEFSLYKYNLGTALAKSGRTADAQQTLSEAAETPGSPRRRDAYYNIGVTLGESTQKKADSQPAAPGAPAPSAGPGAAAAPQPGASPLAQNADPSEALKEKVATLEQSLGAFRKAILIDAKDEDAKLNYETVQEMLRQARQQQQQQQQQNKDGKDKQDKQDQKDGQGQQNQQNKDQQGDQKGQKNGQKGDKNSQPKPGDKQNQDGGDGKDDQLKPEQVDALGLLNLLEAEKPEQFKQLFRFRGGESNKHPQRDW